MKQVKVSLIGLGYTSKTAIVTVRETVETGEVFETIKGLPTLECVSVTFDALEDTATINKYAKQSAFQIVLGRFLGNSGNKPVSFANL